MNRRRSASQWSLFLSSLALGFLVRRVGRRTTNNFDQQWAARLGTSQSAAERVSYLARPTSVLVETLLLASLPVFSGRDAAALVVAWVTAGSAGHALKLYIPRVRPGKERLSPEGDQSFPSTHTAHATALAFTLAEIVREPGTRYWPYVAAGAAGVCVGVARVRAGAHWPTDVLAGALLGFASAQAAFLTVQALSPSTYPIGVLRHGPR